MPRIPSNRDVSQMTSKCMEMLGTCWESQQYLFVKVRLYFSNFQMYVGSMSEEHFGNVHDPLHDF